MQQEQAESQSVKQVRTAQTQPPFKKGKDLTQNSQKGKLTIKGYD
jgi:hypothetical protein